MIRMNDVTIKIKPSIVRLVNLALFFMFIILAVDFINLIRSQPLFILRDKAAFFLYVPLFLISVFFWQKFRSRYHYVVYHNGIRAGGPSHYEDIRWEKVETLDYLSIHYSKAFRLTYRHNDKKGGIVFHSLLTENFFPAIKTILQYLPEDRVTDFAKTAVRKIEPRNQG